MKNTENARHIKDNDPSLLAIWWGLKNYWLIITKYWPYVSPNEYTPEQVMRADFKETILEPRRKVRSQSQNVVKS